MSCVYFLALSGLLACAHAFEDVTAATQVFLPVVGASVGGTATLRCLLHGNPPSKITWKFRAQTIESNATRHKQTPDGSLVIKPLYRSDTGVYICVADNGFGLALQPVHLVVNDPIQGRDCRKFRKEYDQAVDCPYGIHNWTQEGCYRWKCKEDPCVKVNCSSSEHCERIERVHPNSQGNWYSAWCAPGPDCKPFQKECYRLQHCKFGIEKINGTDGCEKCKCKQNLCKTKSCAEGQRCVLQKSMNPSNDQVPLFSAECITMVKAGVCPVVETSPHNDTCPYECADDADCRGVAKTTEFIKTRREVSTTYEEITADVIGTTTLDPCSGFQFGCCADNETEASGPDVRGCLCNATEFGCCPDGVTPASGFENESCPVPCLTKMHGCCQDGKTPAHGPDFEGCCLLQPFECCPDNRKPASGPHLEGCKCQNTLHGCCPDNVTIAQGPDNQGCGCRYTQHGCCPDRHTAASGPNNEGCSCKTYQFGCCADGITIATGPQQRHCHCSESKFGCCGDGETPATGPGAAGCDCSSSRHGCCPDGRTEAAGSNFLGCIDAPEITNNQSACFMIVKPGSCKNYTAKFYYDLESGKCVFFWYGGCEGNDNRFATEDECNTVCSPLSTKDQCRLPIDQGPCAGNFSRWGFNFKAYRCEQFTWGGCEGNSNRFNSEAACQMRCTGTQPPQCTQPQEVGNCTEKEALWSFSQSENRCLPFHYSGCGGNDNRFSSREACEKICPSTYVLDKCTLPYEAGQLTDLKIVRWFYDTSYKGCRPFYYGVSGGNENNFATEVECLNSCSEIQATNTTTITTTTARPVEPQPQIQRPDEPATRSPAPERSDIALTKCLLRSLRPYQAHQVLNLLNSPEDLLEVLCGGRRPIRSTNKKGAKPQP